MLIITPPCTVNYVFIDKPQEFESGKPKYSVMILIDPEHNLNFLHLLKAAFVDVAARHFPDKKDVDVKFPLKYGAKTHPSDEQMSTVFHITARCADAPAVLDENEKRTISEKTIYSGCTAKVAFEILPYKVNGTYGLRCKLGAIQKICDGSSISTDGNVTASQFVLNLTNTPIDGYNAIETEDTKHLKDMTEDEIAEYDDRVKQLTAIQNKSTGASFEEEEDPDDMPF